MSGIATEPVVDEWTAWERQQYETERAKRLAAQPDNSFAAWKAKNEAKKERESKLLAQLNTPPKNANHPRRLRRRAHNCGGGEGRIFDPVSLAKVLVPSPSSRMPKLRPGRGTNGACFNAKSTGLFAFRLLFGAIRGRGGACLTRFVLGFGE